MTYGKIMNAQVDVLDVWPCARPPGKRALSRRDRIIRGHVVDCPEASMESKSSLVKCEGKQP